MAQKLSQSRKARLELRIRESLLPGLLNLLGLGGKLRSFDRAIQSRDRVDERMERVW